MRAWRQSFHENLLLALDTLRTHKFRSFLTVLGVLIGTTTVIAVTSLIAGLDHQLVEVAEQFGTRTLWVYKLQMGAPHALTREEKLRKPLSYEDAMAIKEQVPSATTVSVELFRQMGDFGLPPVTARYKGLEMPDALFVGVTAEHLSLINATLALAASSPRPMTATAAMSSSSAIACASASSPASTRSAKPSLWTVTTSK